MIKILIVDDHAVVRSGLHMILEPEEDVIIVGEAENAKQAIAKARALEPDVILMDIHLPDVSGIEVTKQIKEISPKIAIVALTINEDEEYFFKMLEAGANGYVPKRAAPEELLTAIRAAADNEVYIYPSLAKLLVRDFLHGEPKHANELELLTEREIELLSHLADGATNNEIADTLHISPKTVSRHRENIMKKLNLRNRTELVKFAIRKGIIKP
ncbi:MAG: response regulator transcription factor [Anaerolineales bacterium]|jgi:two-component system response regulator NreC